MKIKGISFNKNCNMYQVTKSLKGKRYHLGYFKTYNEAVKRVLAFEEEHAAEKKQDPRIGTCTSCGATAYLTKKKICYSCVSSTKMVIPQEYLVRGYKYPWEK